MDPCTESLSQHPALFCHVEKTWSSTTGLPCPSCCIPGFTGVVQARAVALSWYSVPGNTFSDSSTYFYLSETSCSAIYKVKNPLRKSRECHRVTQVSILGREGESRVLWICNLQAGRRFPMCSLGQGKHHVLTELSIHHNYSEGLQCGCSPWALFSSRLQFLWIHTRPLPCEPGKALQPLSVLELCFQLLEQNEDQLKLWRQRENAFSFLFFTIYTDWPTVQ